MAKVKIEVFYSPTCPYCPVARKMVADVAPAFGGKVEVEEVNIWTPEGQRRALAYGISAVPTIAIAGKVKFVGVPTSKGELARAIEEEIALAEAMEREWEVCQSMLWNVGILAGVKSLLSALRLSGDVESDAAAAVVNKAAEVVEAIKAASSRQRWPDEEREIVAKLHAALAAADALKRLGEVEDLIEKLIALVAARMPRCREAMLEQR